jgi:hypothetical protein
VDGQQDGVVFTLHHGLGLVSAMFGLNKEYGSQVVWMAVEAAFS